MHMNLIERVQRHFTEWIIELQDLSYQERPSVFNLETSDLWSNHVLQDIS